MLISKFHKLVHDKTFWGIFAGLVCISFIGLYLPGQKGKRAAQKAQTVGKLYGKPILANEYSKARSDAYLTIWLSSGGRFSLNDTTRPLLEEAAWARLATLKKAEQLGLRTSDSEMLQTIRVLPYFIGQNGQFSIQTYNAIVSGPVQRTFGYSKRQFEEVFRDEATIRKVAYLPMQAALVTPEELKDAFHRLNDQFVVQYAELTEAIVKNSVTVSDEEVQQFYDENAARFATPEKVRVKYAQFPVADYLDQVTVSDVEAQAYYDQNLTQYVTKAATTNAPAEYKPFDAVKAEVVGKVKVVSARRKAMEAATEMVIDLTPSRDGTQTMTFEEAAAKMNAAIKMAPDFAADETVEKVDAGREFVSAAFALEDTPRNYYSDAIVGKDYVYVIGLDRRLPSIIPELDSVKANAKALALSQATRNALSKKATDLRDAARAAGADFNLLLTATGAQVKTTPEFSLSGGLEEDPNARLLTGAALSLQAGEISTPLDRADGSLILVKLTERKAADEAEIEPLRETLIAAVENQRLQTIMSGWQESILADAEFEDLMTKGE